MNKIVKQLIITCVIILVGILYFFFFNQKSIEQRELKNMWKGGEIASILPAEKFYGKAKEAYDKASKIPEALDYLYCYCHCEENFGHKSLRTCFATNHGADCDICIGEATLAYELRNRGFRIKEIKSEIDRRFASSKME